MRPTMNPARRLIFNSLPTIGGCRVGRGLRWCGVLLCGVLVLIVSPCHAAEGLSATWDVEDPLTSSPFSYHVYLPASVQSDPQHPRPLLMIYHGAAGPGNAHQSAIATRNFWRDFADQYQVILAAQIATGTQGSWIPSTAERRMHLIIDDLRARSQVDETRLIAWGFSAGGHLLHDIVLRRGQRFAAYAVRAGAIDGYAGPSVIGQAHRRVPVHLSVGVDDPLLPFVQSDQSRFVAGGWIEGDELIHRVSGGGHSYTVNDLRHAGSFMLAQASSEPISAVHSGLWFDPEQPGHGLVIEVIDGDQGQASRINGYWYAFDQQQPLWLTGLGAIENHRALIDLLVADGGQFPPRFRDEDITLDDWGPLRLTTSAADAAHLWWDGTRSDMGQGSLPLRKLGQTSTSGHACLAGSYYPSESPGHGLTVTVLDGGSDTDLAVVTWFVYVDGEQTWLIAQGPMQDHRIQSAPVQLLSGGQFGEAFDSEQVVRQDWGELSIEFDPMGDQLRVDWVSDLASFSSDTLIMDRLTRLSGSACQVPAVIP